MGRKKKEPIKFVVEEVNGKDEIRNPRVKEILLQAVQQYRDNQ